MHQLTDHQQGKGSGRQPRASCWASTLNPHILPTSTSCSSKLLGVSSFPIANTLLLFQTLRCLHIKISFSFSSVSRQMGGPFISPHVIDHRPPSVCVRHISPTLFHFVLSNPLFVIFLHMTLPMYSLSRKVLCKV